jgi:hypothetical protein
MLPAVRPISVGRVRILPPPWPPVAAAPASPERDPLRVLAEAGDRLGIDRRARARSGDPSHLPEAGDGRLTAAVHRPCPFVFALGDRGRWALVKGLSRAPQGLLVELLDPFDKELDLRDRIGVLGMRALGRVAGRGGRPASPLVLVSSCVQARALVDTLARRTSTGGVRAIELVPLLVRTPAGWRPTDEAIDGTPSCILPGELSPLCDPRPGVLAVAVGPAALAALDALVAPRAVPPPAAIPAERATRARRGRKPKRRRT